MSARAFIRTIVLESFPWLGRIGLTAKGDLEIKSASTKIEFAGGDAPIGRVGDGCTRLAFYPGVPGTTPPSLWASTSASPPYVWAPVAICVVTGPTPAEPGTRLEIITGSEKVRSG